MNDVPVSAALLGDVASPPETAPAGQGSPSPEAEQARTEIETLKGDKDFIERYTSGSVEARRRMAALHQAAFPEPPDDTPMPTTPAGQAQAEIEARRGDNEFIRRIEAGDPLAHAELAALDAQAAEPPLPFSFGEDTPIAEVARANRLAGEVIENLGVDRELARGSVAVLDRAVSARLDDNGVPKPMDDLELSRMEFLLKERLGDNYSAAMDNAEGALQRAGAGGRWLQQTILSAGPQTAAWALISLANMRGGDEQ